VKVHGEERLIEAAKERARLKSISFHAAVRQLVDEGHEAAVACLGVSAKTKTTKKAKAKAKKRKEVP
jgi:hypothetical protein